MDRDQLSYHDRHCDHIIGFFFFTSKIEYNVYVISHTKYKKIERSHLYTYQTYLHYINNVRNRNFLHFHILLQSLSFLSFSCLFFYIYIYIINFIYIYSEFLFLYSKKKLILCKCITIIKRSIYYYIL